MQDLEVLKNRVENDLSEHALDRNKDVLRDCFQLLTEAIDRCESAEKRRDALIAMIENMQSGADGLQKIWAERCHEFMVQRNEALAELKELREQKPIKSLSNKELQDLANKFSHHYEYRGNHCEYIPSDKEFCLINDCLVGFIDSITDMGHSSLVAQSRDSAEPVAYISVSDFELLKQNINGVAYVDKGHSGQRIALFTESQSNANDHSEQVNKIHAIDAAELKKHRKYIAEANFLARTLSEEIKTDHPALYNYASAELSSIEALTGLVIDYLNQIYLSHDAQSPAVAVPEFNADLVCAILEDYADMQASGFIPTANRYSASDAMEQVAMLSAPQASAEQKHPHNGSYAAIYFPVVDYVTNKLAQDEEKV